MKMRSLTLSVFVILLAFTACKKDKNPAPVTSTDPELLDVQPDKAAHYSFNGNLNDSSGNHLNATYANNITYTADRFGRANQAVVFGGPNNTSSVLLPSPGSKITGFPFSVSVWFKSPDVSRSQTLIKADGGEYNIYSGYWLQLAAAGSGTMSFNLGNNSGTNNSTARNTITTPAVFSANTWYHIVVNVRGINDMDFYINGAKNTSCTYDGSAASMVFCTQSNQLFGVLGIFMGAGSIFEGLMDDYRIYKKVLPASEISALYNFHP